MTDGDQALLNMLMQINSTLLSLKKLLEDGVHVRTQESRAP